MENNRVGEQKKGSLTNAVFEGLLIIVAELGNSNYVSQL